MFVDVTWIRHGEGHLLFSGNTLVVLHMVWVLSVFC